MKKPYKVTLRRVSHPSISYYRIEMIAGGNSPEIGVGGKTFIVGLTYTVPDIETLALVAELVTLAQKD